MFRIPAPFSRAAMTGMCVVAAALVGAGCSSPVGPPHFARFSQVDLVEGTGDAAGEGLILTVNYTGWLYDPSQAESKGSVFDSSEGRDPFEFILGRGDVIEGWEQGLRGMKIGGIRRLVVPPSMAYQGRRTGGIPPYSTLIFEIQLLSAESPVTEIAAL